MIKILIIEDNKSQSEMIASILDKNKYEIFFAYTGNQALDILLTDTHFINLVLVDYHLPDFNGIEIIEKVKQTNKLYSFIFVTADNNIDTVVKAMRAGACYFIQKNKDLTKDLPIVLDKVYENYLLKKSQTEIDNQLKILSAGVEQSGSVIVVTDLEGKIEYVNKRFTEVTGYTLTEAKGQNPRILKSGDKPNEYYQDLWNKITNGQTWKGEFINKRKDGELFYEEAIISPIKNKSGEIIKYMAVKDDITIRKQIENEIKQKNEELFYEKILLEQIINTIPNPVFVKNSDLRYVLCNNSFADNILGLPKNKIIGKSVFDISPKKLADNYNKSDLQFKNNELSFQEYETQVKFTDEKLHDIIFYKASLQNSENEFAGLVGIMLDITERKKQEFQLERSKKSLQEAQKIGNVGHWEYDVINDNMYMSEQMYRIYELKRETFKPTIDSIIALIHPEDKDYVVNTYNETFTKTPFFEIEHKVITAKGNLKYIKDKAETHFDGKGNPTRIIGNVQDITDLKLKELKLIENNKVIEEYAQELKKLNDDKDRFIRILAHDLKNPFNSLLGFAELLVKNIRKYDIEKIEKQLKIIYTTTKQTYNLLEDLLLWSKSQSGKLPFEPQIYLFNEICNELISYFKTNSKNIIINCLETERTKIIADLNMLKTVMRNLVSNAIKFTNPNGNINIYSEKSDESIIITVSDNGIGIPQENITKLWDYTQLITTSGTKGERGTGIGLPLCKEFVEKQGGQIWVESEVGKGSDFKFTLPLINEN